MKTIRAIKSCNFIHFNSAERVSFMIFDFDTYNNKRAVETFKDIDMFYNYIIKHIGIEATYITQTKKGYQFAYHLKNHVYTHQKKALNYLNNIKKAIIEKLGCDTRGSTRNHGIWRNPLKHEYYFSQKINYELKDFKEFAIPKKTYKNNQKAITIKRINKDILVKGNRNHAIFIATMSWAKYQKVLTQNDIYTYAIQYNNQAQEPLEDSEILSISKSVYRYYCNGSIFISSNNKKKNINEGVMKLEKMKGLTKQEYDNEVKKRQKLSAERTNSIVDKNHKKELMLKAKNIHIENQKKDNALKIKNAIEELKKLGLKINNSSIGKLAGIDRKTVRKYQKLI
jgi:hypothetical protein